MRQCNRFAAVRSSVVMPSDGSERLAARRFNIVQGPPSSLFGVTPFAYDFPFPLHHSGRRGSRDTDL